MTAPVPDSTPLEAPAVAAPPSPTTIAAGPPIPAVDRLRHFSPDQWEDFVVEWADALRSDYLKVGRLGGAGDQGRDVIGYLHDGSYDHYQCKHYARALQPTDIWLEIGKVVYYTRSGTYSRPRKCFFVAPCGAGTALSNLLDEPALLREGLLKNWERYCETKISSTKGVLLDQQLEQYIEDFPFEIFGAIPPHRLIDVHSKTRWHAARFGGGLPNRPVPEPPPPEPTSREVRYVRALLEAYADHLKQGVNDVDDLPEDSRLRGHFGDSRRAFWSAEALRLFSRDWLPPRAFKQLQMEVHSGITDTLRDEHDDGYRRLRAASDIARGLPLSNHPLHPIMSTQDRAGVCHQLANDGTIRSWVA